MTEKPGLGISRKSLGVGPGPPRGGGKGPAGGPYLGGRSDPGFSIRLEPWRFSPQPSITSLLPGVHAGVLGWGPEAEA